VVKIPDLAKRANKLLQGCKVLRERRGLRGPKAPLGQREVTVRLSTSSRSAAQHPRVLWAVRKESVSSMQSVSLLVAQLNIRMSII
jgi:hypothetical protein